MITAYYDLAVSPPTYDIVAFLQMIEGYRLSRGEDRIDLQILPGPVGGFRRDRFWPFSVEERQQMLNRVALPMARMLPSVAELRVRTDRPPNHAAARGSIGYMSRLYGLKVQVEMMRRGIRPLRPKIPLPREPRLVTITLREAEHWPHRNSNVDAWAGAARALQARGFDVVVLRDTLKSSEPLAGLKIAPVASRDLERRATLYRQAACNLGISNGPLWFAMALDAPVLMLRPVSEGGVHAASLAYFRECGIEPGGQIPGAPPYQRLVWADDTAAEILRAFDAYMADQERRRAA